MAGFPGFGSPALAFLAGLVHNNERAWFEAHRQDYETHILAPALALIAEMDPLLKSISPHYRGVAKKIGGSLMRIYRDTRFSRDKTPYKTNIGIQFRHENAADVHAPGWYVHLDLQSSFVGAGTWHPEPADLAKIRRRIADQPDSFTRALKKPEASGMTLAGDSLVRPPQGYDPAHPLIAQIRRKDFLLSADLDPALFASPALVPELEKRFRATAPFMEWLCQTLGAPF